MIHVQNLTKLYRTQYAIKDINFTAHSGEILGLLGPNGAGKTTLMRILTCSLWPSSGGAKVAGYDIFESPFEIKKRVGYLPETPPLYKEMSVQSYLGYVAQLKEISWQRRSKRVAEVIELCALQDYRKARIRTLSRGYCQRVGLAQGIIHDPEILILDEPTNGLDPIQIREFRSLLRHLSEKRTILLSTHILAEATLLCHRIAILNKGELVGIDTLDKLSQKFKGSLWLELTLGNSVSGIESEIKKIMGVRHIKVIAEDDKLTTLSCELASEDCRPKLLRLIADQGWNLIELKRVEPSLEDVFLDMVKKR